MTALSLFPDWSDAEFSECLTPESPHVCTRECRPYRYRLTRRWEEGGRRALFVGVNPSTADEIENDNTIRRCIAFAQREGCSALTMANLFAYRARDPKEMKCAEDPVGPGNDVTLGLLALEHDLVVAAWGVHGRHRGRAPDVTGRGLLGPDVQCFGTTLAGDPLHPLYLDGDTPLVPYAP